MEKTLKYLNFVFTWNNYTDENISTLASLKYKYIYYGKEIAPTTGTPHLQGYICLIHQASESSIRKKMKGAYVKAMRGSLEKNDLYCSKGGIVTELGTKPATQKRKGEMEKERYEHAYEAAKKGDFESIDKDILIRHLGNLKKIRAEHQVKPQMLDGTLDNLWIYGPPGSGKTSLAHSLYPEAYLKGLNKWWDGYDNQEVVIIDDMDPFHKTLTQEFKVWSHHYPFPAETKGGSLCIRPKKIIVTSNYRIDEIWEDETTRQALHRRFKEEYIPSNRIILDNETLI